ncbi:mto 1 responding up 1 [Striga hermonthica]|uniref:Mto 1 responding up 1 n=1 Tax=Striga hermonthica TaxID=68872 RepID=A0A9N7NZ73_STRHE|nr:mto 1 responding up 1 [Striga hermonthica]
MAHALSAQSSQPTWGGSIPGHRVVHRDREEAHRTLFRDYFSSNPTYDEDTFRQSGGGDTLFVAAAAAAPPFRLGATPTPSSGSLGTFSAAARDSTCSGAAVEGDEGEMKGAKRKKTARG